MIIKALDKLSGMLVGAVTGCLAVIWQVPFAYYLFAKTMRRAKYSWFTTILATLTVGHIAAFISSSVSLLFFFTSPLYGMMVGFKKGLLGALTLPLNLHLEIDKYSVFMLTDDRQDGPFKWMGTESIWGMIKQFFFFGGFSFTKILNSILKESRMIEDAIEKKYRIYQVEEILSQCREEQHRIQSLPLTREQRDAAVARISQLLNRVDSLLNSPTARAVTERLRKNHELIGQVMSLSDKNTIPFPCLEDKEIAEFKSVIDAEKDEPTKKRNLAIYDYITSHCLISLEPLSELSKLKDDKERAVAPITVIGTFSERSYVRTYDYASFLTYLEVEKNKTRPIAVLNGTADGDCLEDKEHIDIRRGFYPVNVAYIRAEIKRGKEKEKQADAAHIQAEIKREEEKEVKKDASHTKTEWHAKQAKIDVAPIQAEIKKEEEKKAKKDAWLKKIERGAKQVRERQSQANSHFSPSLSSSVAAQGAVAAPSRSSAESLRITKLRGHLFAPQRNNPSQLRKLSENRLASKL